MKYFICSAALWLIILQFVQAQCNHTLVEIAAKRAGPEAVYIRDFKVKLSEGTMNNPSPVGHFQVFLNEGIKYRFTIASDENSKTFAVLQVMRRDKILGSTYDFGTHQDLQRFDMLCEESGTYNILISFNESKPGCAAAVLSLVLMDSMVIVEPNIPTKSDSAGIIYLFIDNEMNIAATGIPEGYLEVSSSNGDIIKKGGIYLAHPKKSGQMLIKVNAFNKQGELNESDSIVYKVDYPPLPQLILPGMRGNVIYKSTLPGRNNIELQTRIAGMDGVYKLLEFTLSSKMDDFFGAVANGSYLTQKQIDIIRTTPVGGKIYLINIRFSDPEGKTHLIPLQEIFVQD